MTSKLSIIFTILAVSTVLCGKESKKESLENDIHAYAQMASSFLSEQNAEQIGGVISNLVQSEGGKQLGDMLTNLGGGGKNTNQILQSLGTLISQGSKAGGGGDNGAFDPSVLASVIQLYQAFSSSGGGSSGSKNSNQILQSLGTLISQGSAGSGGEDDNGEFGPSVLASMAQLFQTSSEGGKEDSNDDAADLLSTVGSLLGQEGALEGIMNFLPLLMGNLESSTGDKTRKLSDDHSSHAWFMPPVLEKLHILFDNFMNSELGKSVMKSIGTEKFWKVFTDANGKFSYNKFVELLENQSFRKHWIEMVTRRIAVAISYLADAKVQARFLTTAQFFFNNFLKSQGVPTSAMFDPVRPTETLTAFANYMGKKYLGHKIDAKQYIKPAVEYVQDLIKLAQNKGYFAGKGIDSSELSHKLADTINLEIIEPVARVYRAYRFAKKHPKCDKYVMCVVNQMQPNEKLSLPGLKSTLSKGSSMLASWFLGSNGGGTFWSLYQTITENKNCQTLFLKSCNEFHVEEIKVTTRYEHNEL